MFDVRRSTFDVQRSTFDVRRSTFNVQRSTFDVRRSTFNVRRSTFDVQRSTFDVRRSTFDVRRSTFDVRRSTFNVRRSTFDGRRAFYHIFNRPCGTVSVCGAIERTPNAERGTLDSQWKVTPAPAKMGRQLADSPDGFIRIVSLTIMILVPRYRLAAGEAGRRRT